MHPDHRDRDILIDALAQLHETRPAWMAPITEHYADVCAWLHGAVAWVDQDRYEYMLATCRMLIPPFALVVGDPE